MASKLQSCARTAKIFLASAEASYVGGVGLGDPKLAFQYSKNRVFTLIMELRMTETFSCDEQHANRAARAAMGEIAWPTIALAAVLFPAYGGVIAVYAAGGLPIWAATAILAVILYATYTVVHEAVHASISGKSRRLKPLNDALGFIGGQLIGTPFTAHRKEHLAHHAHTNHEGRDPDLRLARGGLGGLLAGTLRALPHQVAYYLKNNWAKASGRDRTVLVAEIVVAIAWRLALAYSLGLTAAVFLLIVANLIGIFITLVLFAWIVHRPHTATERYRDTSSFVFPKPFDTAISSLWLFQNYHAIHHLFPRVPFYRYRQVFRQIEPVMVRQGSPIFRIGAAAPQADADPG